VNGLALVLGITHEPPVARVVRELARLNLPHAIVDQRQLLHGSVATWWEAGAAGGIIEVPGAQISLDDVAGVYSRLTNWSDLPGVSSDPAILSHAYQIHEALDSWLEVTTVNVVNRSSANDTNNSKPYQALLIRDHFDLPATLVTNDPRRAQEFRQEFGRIIYKSISGERSIVTCFTEADVERLPLLANAPVQFQEHISGIDIRVHVIGSELFATRVESDATDYRYDETGGGSMKPFELSSSVAHECISLTHRLGLEMSGIDLRFADDGRVVCFEVNPSPAYIAYEEATGQPMAAALARHLCG
jgi:glutathione synthase/RimK-type ligase-like ATP-grasp enzyme